MWMMDHKEEHEMGTILLTVPVLCIVAGQPMLCKCMWIVVT